MDFIVGAGISGLSYVNFSVESNYLIIDKDKEPGGYCKTVKQDGFVWDYSGHFFNYSEKLYACNLKDLDVNAMSRFPPYAETEENH